MPPLLCFLLSALLLLILPVNFRSAGSDVCLPPFVPAKDGQGHDCCKLPPEIFPHKTIYEEFCDDVYFGTMVSGPDGPFCRMSTSQKRRPVNCEPGWVPFFEGMNQFCYKAITIDDPQNEVDTAKDPCPNIKSNARLVRVPNQSINMFLYVRVLNGTQHLQCDLQNELTFYYFIGLERRGFDWLWHPYDTKAYSDLIGEAEELLIYLNNPRSKHFWADGTPMFADGWDDPDEITTHVVISDCGLWRDVRRSNTNFTHNSKHVINQGYICAYHV